MIKPGYVFYSDPVHSFFLSSSILPFLLFYLPFFTYFYLPCFNLSVVYYYMFFCRFLLDIIFKLFFFTLIFYSIRREGRGVKAIVFLSPLTVLVQNKYLLSVEWERSKLILFQEEKINEIIADGGTIVKMEVKQTFKSYSPFWKFCWIEFLESIFFLKNQCVSEPPRGRVSAELLREWALCTLYKML